MSDHAAQPDRRAADAAAAIRAAFLAFQDEFHRITRRAQKRFESQDWHGTHRDAAERLELYSRVMDGVIEELQQRLAGEVAGEALWGRIKASYSASIDGEPNDELAATFFNSATRRIFSTVGVNPAIEFVTLSSAIQPGRLDPRVYRHYPAHGDTAELLQRMLQDYRFDVGYRDLRGDVELAARAIDRYLEAALGSSHIDALDTCIPIYYRDKGAYIVGRLSIGDRLLPLVLPLRSHAGGISIDATLMKENDVSVLFSFTRSYFQVDARIPSEQILFLKTIMPKKPIAELYIALGFNKHGKTELYRSVRRHVLRSSGRFELAEGDRGMVMIVFALPLFDVVFKMIRDRFAYPKTTTRQDVMDRYRLVFQHDRVGRLVDAQEFEHLTFPKSLFSEELLEELLSEAGQTVSVNGEDVAIEHVYTERKITPLNLYVRRAGAERARNAVIDYGHAIKQLAAANIFPGDFLLKNFGVTRHGRVVFYDYDELCLLTDCNFRRMPVARNLEDELDSEPWFTVGPADIFPEEFRKFLGLQGEMRDLFIERHSDLFTVEFWAGLQERHRSGEILEFFPYPDERRLRQQPDDEP